MAVRKDKRTAPGLSAVLTPVHLEMFGNCRAQVEGCRGIIEYETELIRLNMGKMILCFKGRSLCIRCMNRDSLVVEGYITAVEFFS